MSSEQGAVKERPILFSGEMVRAILEGRKTQTRRVIKPQPKGWNPAIDIFGNFGFCLLGDMDHSEVVYCPFKVGMRLWVRETWAVHPCLNRIKPRHLAYDNPVYYRSDPGVNESHFMWRSSIHIPRWASRITLEITGVRVERVQETSEADAITEGFPYPLKGTGADPVGWYKNLWDSLNAKRGYPWSSNPWVWVVEFRRVVP